jgi:hypothetical protein
MPFEHVRRSVTCVLMIRKPFDVLAEGLLSKNSRDDWISTEPQMCLFPKFSRAVRHSGQPDLRVQ